MHVFPADIYVLTCFSLALSLCIFALEYYDFVGYATVYVGTTVSALSIILHSTTLLCLSEEEDLEKHWESLVSSVPFILVMWTMVCLWTFALAALTMAHFLGVSQMACGGDCWLNAQGMEFILILCEIVNTLCIAINFVREFEKVEGNVIVSPYPGE